MSTAANIIDSTPILGLIADLENRARVFLESDQNDPRGKVYSAVSAQLKKALEQATSAERWGTPEEVAAHIGMPADTVRLWARKKRLESRRPAGSRRWLVRYPTWERN